RVSIVRTKGTILFFFSSRRRHTRCYRDWSSDVCSPDLGRRIGSRGAGYPRGHFPSSEAARSVCAVQHGHCHGSGNRPATRRVDRSEERRVGKEGRWRGRTELLKRKDRYGKGDERRREYK